MTFENSEKQGTELSNNETDLSFIIRKRLELVENEFSDFKMILVEFAKKTDSEMINFVRTMERLQTNINRVKILPEVQESQNLSQVRSDNRDPVGNKNKQTELPRRK